MSVANKIIALLDTMTAASLDSLPPIRRRQFADLCRHWAKIADKSKDGMTLPKVGVLADLKDGERAH
jgi:hypothetical protein